ncbi:hypothetical protein [Extibacter muris]|uniref:hypothetical protein n=2 Tax=Extibacter muris TaxID=1796622 RepID=UPI001D096339|nr:hypothetical protein [Extibacter muris]MCB6203424.1 hypothetical protein [Extibacter muris]MCQ4665000.1 hypothetical protein [Extibacter muris]MCQ4694365.1 hypothetical protein [Extibacter muris]
MYAPMEKKQVKKATSILQNKTIQMLRGVYHDDVCKVAGVHPVKMGPVLRLLAFMDGREVEYNLDTSGKAVIDEKWILQTIQDTVQEGLDILKETSTTVEDKKTILSAFQMMEYLSLDQHSSMEVGRFSTHGVTNMRNTDGQVKESMRKNARELTEIFYDFIGSTRQHTEDLTDTIILYRAVRMELKSGQEKHMEILPSSTSWSLDFCKGWAGDDKEQYIIFEITVPLSFPLLFSSFPDHDSKYRFSSHINQGQSEVLLAPSQLSFTGPSRKDDGYTIQPCSAASLSLDDALQLIGPVPSAIPDEEEMEEDD